MVHPDTLTIVSDAVNSQSALIGSADICQRRPVQTFAERLAFALKRSGLKQNDFEKKAGLANGYATRLLDGDRVGVASDRLERIAEVLGVNYVWLATGRGHIDASEPSKYATLERLLVERAAEFDGLDTQMLRSYLPSDGRDLSEVEWYAKRDEFRALRSGKAQERSTADTSETDAEHAANVAAMKAKLKAKSKPSKPKTGSKKSARR